MPKKKVPRSQLPLTVYEVLDESVPCRHFETSMRKAVARARSIALAEYQHDLSRFIEKLTDERPLRRDYAPGGEYYPRIEEYRFKLTKSGVVDLINRVKGD